MKITSGRHEDGTRWARATQRTRHHDDTRVETVYAIGLTTREARGRAAASMFWRLGRYVESWHTFNRVTPPNARSAS